MPGTRRPFLKYTGFGCLTVAVLVILVLASSFTCIQLSGNESMSSREEVDALYADPATFTPQPDGGFSHDRIRRLLAVRDALTDACPQFTDYARAFGRMDDYSDEEEIADKGAFMTDVGRAIKGSFGIARHLNTYIIVRNRALLEQELGHGEFTWLFVMVYYSWLGHQPQPFMLANDEEPWQFAARIRPQVRAMFERWVEVLNSHPTRSGDSELASLRLICQGELAALQADPDRLPFADGWPSTLTRELESYRAELEATFCPATEELDLTRTEREGIGFEHR